MSVANDARFWDRTSRKYAMGAIADQVGYERTLDRTRALLVSGDSVLELGCGTGTTALRLAGDVQDYLAADISAGMIAIATEKHAAGSIPALVFRTATAEALMPDAAQFNAVLGFNYLHLVRDLPLRRGYEPTHPVGLVARDARGRQSTLCRRLSRGGPEPAYMCRGLRHSYH